MIASPDSYLSTVNDYYHAHLIDLNAKAYGVSDTSKLKKAIESKVKNSWTKDFSEDKFAIKDQEISEDSFKIIEIMSTQKDSTA